MTARITGPLGSSASVPFSSYAQVSPWLPSFHRPATHLLRLHGHTEENDTLQSLLYEGPDEALELVDTPPTLTWQRRHLLSGIGVVGDEDGVHEHGFGELARALPCAGDRVLVATLQNRPVAVSASCPLREALKTDEISMSDEGGGNEKEGGG